MKNLKIKLFGLFLLAALSFSCEDLVVENINDPNKDDILYLSDEATLELYGKLYHNWFKVSHIDFNSTIVGFNLTNLADAGTCSWNKWLNGFAGYEPAKAFVQDRDVYHAYESFYKQLYIILHLSNDLIYITNTRDIYHNDVNVTQMLKAYAYFNQGISLGYLGLLFDRAFIVNENTDLEKDIPLSNHKSVINAALEGLDKAIDICEEETFTVPESWISGYSFNQNTFKQLVSSYAARILAYSPRNKSENESIDWERVYTYASEGIDYDFAPVADDVEWYSLYHTYSCYPGWCRVDMRMVNMMDPDMPSRWPDVWDDKLSDYENTQNSYNYLPEPKTTIEEAYDDRLITDYDFLWRQDFNSERGIYFYSCYRFSRHDDYLSTWVEPIPEMLKAENDLLLAEASLMTEKYAEAANIINNGTRVTRGGLPPIAVNPYAIEDAIFHERNIELHISGMGIEYFTMRKADKLQYGSVLHFPIPAAELEVMNMDIYTFGPEVGIAGVDYSVGGWD